MCKVNTRVLLISPLPPPSGGIASWTHRYLEWSQSNRLEADVVNTAVIGRRKNHISSNLNLLDELERTFAIIKDLKTKLSEFKPDVVHLNTPCGRFGIIRDYICAKLIKKNDIPLVVHYRCNIEDQIRNNKFQNYFLEKLSLKADVNLVLNSPSKVFLDKLSDRNNILLANFIDENYIIKKPKKIKSNIESISFVGHVQRTKGVFEIIEVAKRHPKISFILAGPISNEIKQFSIPNNVLMKESLTKTEVRDVLTNSDLFLFPSYTEGFANALLEAMSLGLPVIATPVGANEDMIEHNGGIIVIKKDTDAISNAINQMEDQMLRQTMSNWNVNKVKENYVIDNVMKEIILIYKTIIK